jgi:hypothetical protein
VPLQVGGDHLRNPQPAVRGQGLRQTLLAQFHHHRSGLIFLAVTALEPPSTRCFARGFQNLPDHQGFKLFGDTGDLFGRIGFFRRVLEGFVKGLILRNNGAVAGVRKCPGARR